MAFNSERINSLAIEGDAAITDFTSRLLLLKIIQSAFQAKKLSLTFHDMAGIAQYHFPQNIWKNGERLLWNPIQKKALKNRPEERVRLRIIEALIEMGWSKNRISTEESIDKRNLPAGRTDIICYDKEFLPKILVECKAENVPISSKVAGQTARYNRAVGAPYLLMSNGISDYWYRITDRMEISRLEKTPDFLDPSEKPDEQPFSYWMERGFAGQELLEEGRTLLAGMLNRFWFHIEGSIDFLYFSESPTSLDLTHYYKIFGSGDKKNAVGFLNTPADGTRLVAVFNRHGENVGVLEADIDLLISGETPNSTLYIASGPQKIDLQEHGLSVSELSNQQSLNELPNILNIVFNKYNG